MLGLNIAKWAGKVLWTPSALGATTRIWYDASDLTTITSLSGSVSQITDKSGNNYHLTQGNGAYQPTTGETLNGRHAVRFNLQYMRSTSISLPTTAITALCVMRNDVVSTINGRIVSLSRNLTSTDYNGQDGISILYRQNGGNLSSYQNGNISTRGPIGLNVIFLGSATFNGTTNSMTTYLNGTAGNTVSTYDPEPATMTVFNTGVSQVNAGVLQDYAKQTMGEIILLTSVDTTNRQKVEGYLAWRWGLQGSLDGAHPYKSAPPYV